MDDSLTEDERRAQADADHLTGAICYVLAVGFAAGGLMLLATGRLGGLALCAVGALLGMAAQSAWDDADRWLL